MCSTPKRLFGTAPLPLGVLYTVPTGQRAVLRHIQVANNSGGATGFTLSIGTNAAGSRLFQNFQVAGNGVLSQQLYIPLESGETIEGSGNANLDVTLGGDELSL